MSNSPVVACDICIEIGGMSVLVRTDSPEFVHMLEGRYSGFVQANAAPAFEFEVELVPPGRISDEEEIAVSRRGTRWLIERGDLRAEVDLAARRGHIVQSANPYAIDTALRILHSLVLAREGGLLFHAASAVRNGKAYLFSGVSGAGKTTISRLAPPDVTLLTDEISYVRRSADSYVAFGTPFAGELAKLGENIEAPLEAVYLLRQGPENRIDPLDEREAVRLLLQNILFFAEDDELVGMVFESACELARQVRVARLTFLPDARVWELMG
jgi:hypothetical protein